MDLPLLTSKPDVSAYRRASSRLRLWLVVLTVAAASASDTKPRNRIVRVVSVSQADLSPGTQLLEQTLERLELSASFRPDIACLPETFTEGEPEL